MPAIRERRRGHTSAAMGPFTHIPVTTLRLIFTIHHDNRDVHLRVLIHIQLILINRIVSTLTLTRISFFIFQVDHFHIIVAFIDIDNPMLWLIPFYNAASYDRSTRQGSGVQIRMDSGCQRGSYVEMGKCDLL